MNTPFQTGPDRQALCAVVRQARAALGRRVERAASIPPPLLARHFRRLVAAVETGLRREEDALEALGVAGLHARRRDHALILSAFHHALPAVERGDAALGRQLIVALRDLLELHRLPADLVRAPGTPANPGIGSPHEA